MRQTYRYDDTASLAASATAPAFSTPALAARTRPASSAIARLRTAHETSRASRLTARPAVEAPQTDTTRYVHVDFTHTVTYRGRGAAAPQSARWTLRLVADRRGRWLVDAVLSTG